MNPFTRDILMRSLKVLDMGYVACIYFIVGILMARAFDKLYGKFDKEKEKKKTFLKRTIELIVMLWIIGIVSYFVRNIVELIPTPYNNFYGYNHLRLNELKSATVFTFIFLFFQSFFKAKVQFYYDTLPF
jgi:hypothetical protein